MIEVPAIKPYKQVTVNNRINTDRCFLLIEKVDFSVKSCSAEGLAGRPFRPQRFQEKSLQPVV